MTTWLASGYAYDPSTNDWTKRIEYVARNEMEAIRWCNMNQNWLKNLQRIEIKLGSGNFYTA